MKTDVVNGVLTSYELMLAIYLGTLDGKLDHAATILCGSDAVTDPVLDQIIAVKWLPMDNRTPNNQQKTGGPDIGWYGGEA